MSFVQHDDDLSARNLERFLRPPFGLRPAAPRRHDDDDLSVKDVERFLCAPHGLRFETLEGFPSPSYVCKDGGRWTHWDLKAWLEGFFRGLAPMTNELQDLVRREALMLPDSDPHEHRERALARFVAVATARVLMKRLP